MKIAYILYDGITLLDFAGVFDPITRIKTMDFIPDLSFDVCAQKDIIRSFEGLEIKAWSINSDLSKYDYIIVPGGNGIQELLTDKDFINWITVKSESAVIAALCGGVLLLGATGLLRDKKVTTHPNLQGVLQRFAKEVSKDRIVEDGNIITAGGVTAGIDLGLYLCEKIAGREVREKIQTQMDYPTFPVNL